MGVTKTVIVSLVIGALCALGRSQATYDDDSAAIMKAHAAQDEAERAARWQDLQHAVFGARSVQDGAGVIEIDAPEHALDAALVPVTLILKGAQPIKGVYLVIDNNPSPVASHFTFGPRADPRTLKLRVRVNMYTYMH